MQPLAPIVLFVYNRPETTRQTLMALVCNKLADESELFIYADGAKNNASEDMRGKISEVRKIIREKQWCKKVAIIESDKNKGLAASVIEGVSEILKKNNSVIVLEDDLITSPHFLKYMNEALNRYVQQDDVISIHGYCVPINYKQSNTFFLKGADCWGWGTWKRGWDLMQFDGTKLRDTILDQDKKYEFDFKGTYPYFDMLEKSIKKEVDSWAILWYASAFIKNKLTLYPSRSLIKNIGTGADATHKQNKHFMQVELTDKPVIVDEIPIMESKEARKLFAAYFFKHLGLRNKIKKILGLGY